MMYNLGNRLFAWWVAAVVSVVGVHSILEQIGWDDPKTITMEAALVIVLMVFPYIFIHRRVLRPLTDIGETAKRITSGDLSARSRVDSPVEFKMLSDSLNEMVEKLADSYERLKETNVALEKAVLERTRALSVERDKLSSIIRSIPDGMVFVSVTGEILEVNPMMESIWGLSPGELPGRMVDDLPDGPVKDSLINKCKAPVRHRCWEVFNCIEKNCPAYLSDDVRCWLISGTYCHKGVQTDVKRKREEICSQCSMYKEVMEVCGEVREIEVSGRHYKISSALVLDKDNRVIGELKTFSDVTAEKQLEKRKADFISLVTHDLKSPLTGIIGYSDLLMSSEGAELAGEEMDFVRSIQGSARKLLEMVEQYLDLTKMEAGMLELRKAPVQPGELVDETVSEFRAQAREKGISLTVAVEDGLRPIEADRGKMARVVANLVSNAVKYTPKGGAITITGRESVGADGTPSFELTVSDTGYGISEEDLPHIFDHYYRSEKTSGIKGTGLGLAVVKSLVDAHKGEVSVKSRPGEGSAFTVRIPVKA